MRVAPVSADLLVKLAIAGAVLAGVWYATRRVTQTLDAGAEWAANLAESALGAVGDAANTVNPFNPDNTVSKVLPGVTDWSNPAALFGPTDADAWAGGAPIFGGGATGSW